MPLQEYIDLYEELDLSDAIVEEMRKKLGRVWLEILEELAIEYLTFEDLEEIFQGNIDKALYWWESDTLIKVEETYKGITLALSAYLTSTYANVAGRGIPYSSAYSVWAKDGKSLSQRLMNHAQKVTREIAEVVKKGLESKVDVGTVLRQVKERFNVAESNLARVVRTEVNKTINDAMLDDYIKQDFTHYEYQAILDSRTSEICRNLDGEIFLLTEAVIGENRPPMHANCRSFITPLNLTEI